MNRTQNALVTAGGMSVVAWLIIAAVSAGVRSYKMVTAEPPQSYLRVDQDISRQCLAACKGNKVTGFYAKDGKLQCECDEVEKPKK